MSFYAVKILCSRLSECWKWGLATWRFGARNKQNTRVANMDKHRPTLEVTVEKKGNIEEKKW